MTTTSARRAAAFCLLLVVPMLSVLGLGTAASATNASYWVDATAAACSDAGSGTQAAPFCSISAAAKKAVGPGDTVHVRTGTYREQVTVAGSGASHRPDHGRRRRARRRGARHPGSRRRGPVDRLVHVAWTTPYAPPSAPRQVFLDDTRLRRRDLRDHDHAQQLVLRRHREAPLRRHRRREPRRRARGRGRRPVVRRHDRARPARRRGQRASRRVGQNFAGVRVLPPRGHRPGSPRRSRRPTASWSTPAPQAA